MLTEIYRLQALLSTDLYKIVAEELGAKTLKPKEKLQYNALIGKIEQHKKDDSLNLSK